MNKCHHPSSWQAVGGNFQGLDPSPISRTHRKGVGGMDTRHLAHIVLASLRELHALTVDKDTFIATRLCSPVMIAHFDHCLGDADLDHKVKTNHKNHNTRKKKKKDETSWVSRQLGVVSLHTIQNSALWRSGSHQAGIDAGCKQLAWLAFLALGVNKGPPARAQGLVRRPGCPASSPNPMGPHCGQGRTPD